MQAHTRPRWSYSLTHAIALCGLFLFLAWTSTTGCSNTPNTETHSERENPADAVDAAAPEAPADRAAPEQPADATPDATTDDAAPTDATAPQDGDRELSFATHIMPIFQQRYCSAAGCHSGEEKDLGAGLRLGGPASDVYNNLINVKSQWVNPQTKQKDSTWIRVVPGKPEESLLYEKVAKNPPAQGKAMPATGGTIPPPPLTQAQLQTVYDWIAQGAKP